MVINRSVSSRKLAARLALLGLLGLGWIIQRFSSEKLESFLQALPYRCPLRWLTGWKCAFCGMTHSWIAIFKGDWKTAFDENLFGIPLFISMAAILIGGAITDEIRVPWRKATFWAVVIFSGYAIFRNL